MPSVLKKFGLLALNNCVRQNSFLTKLLFGVRTNNNERIHWDFTTLLLKKCLKNYIHGESKILEVGTGPYALLSVYLAKKFKCHIESCDINREYVGNSALIARENNAEIMIYQSDLFEAVKDKFDLIFFNSVYIPEQTGIKLGISRLHKYKTDWCGGVDGVTTIKKYLSSCGLFLNSGGKVFLGFNPHYLEFGKIKNIYSEYGLKIFALYKKPCNPSRILIFTKT
ncbi:MAG: hypothetical protein EHM79_20920 [Geobacter sp.]|nr:MAG: hypothetical protein EHM79_20920 [Geobacter sp.]